MVARALRSAAVSFLLAGFLVAFLQFLYLILAMFQVMSGSATGVGLVAGGLREAITVFLAAWGALFFFVYRSMGRTLPPRIE